MRSPLHFLIRPKNGQEYVQENKDGLILTTSIEDHVFTQRLAYVEKTPIGYIGEIKEGDTIVVHHNTFRTQYDNQGFPRPSMYHIQDDLYFIEHELVYAIVKDNGDILPIHNYVLVTPIIEDSKFEGKKAMDNIATVAYSSNSMINEQNICKGDIIAMKADSEYEFNINGEKLYLLKGTRILFKIERTK